MKSNNSGMTQSLELAGDPGVDLDFEHFVRMASPMSVTTNKAFDLVHRDNKINMRELDASNVLDAFPSAFHSEDGSNEDPRMRRRSSQRLRNLFESKFFEIFMVSILLANVLWMAMHLQVYGQVALTEAEVPVTWSAIFKCLEDYSFSMVYITLHFFTWFRMPLLLKRAMRW